MKLPEKFNCLLRVPRLTRLRMVVALAIAVVADGLQLLLVWLPFADQIIDVISMALTSWVIGFHWLLLPTFVMEFIPLVDALPTWTACVIAVVALRKREQRTLPPEKPVIEI